jgi:small subunit ribosomal protein S4
MSRYTGPSWKQSRRLGYSVLGTEKELAKRPYGPGQHGNDRKKKPSEYGKQLIEKQKLRFTYGVSEKQFRRFFMLAKAQKGVVTGTAFMQLLESRLDNVVFRLGFATTRRAARQLVNHGHVTVNGKKVNIASFLVKPGSVIAVKGLAVVKASLEAATIVPAYVTVDKEKLEGTFVRLPERSELTKAIDESAIVEYYNRML